MPLSEPRSFRLIQRVLGLRGQPLTGSAVAIAAILVATVLRWQLDYFVVGTPPFTTYYLALLLVALVGGVWPGILAAVFSGYWRGSCSCHPSSAFR
jgi:K+-sensing histidine kinase KdpD